MRIPLLADLLSQRGFTALPRAVNEDDGCVGEGFDESGLGETGMKLFCGTHSRPIATFLVRLIERFRFG